MSPTPDSTSDDPQQVIADLQRDHNLSLAGETRRNRPFARPGLSRWV